MCGLVCPCLDIKSTQSEKLKHWEGYLEKVQTEVDLPPRTLFIPLYFVKAEAIILKKVFAFWLC